MRITPSASGPARRSMADLLIFVFAGISCGRRRVILAEFAPVPNAPSESADASSSAVSPRSPAARPIATQASPPPPASPEEFGGPTGPEPTRYGDWEKNGRCVDF
jgi:hypothetical protein